MMTACHPKASQGCIFENDCPRTNPRLWDLPGVSGRKYVEYEGGPNCTGRMAVKEPKA